MKFISIFPFGDIAQPYQKERRMDMYVENSLNIRDWKSPNIWDCSIT